MKKSNNNNVRSVRLQWKQSEEEEEEEKEKKKRVSVFFSLRRRGGRIAVLCEKEDSIFSLIGFE